MLWIAAAWVTISIPVSLALGAFFAAGSRADAEAAVTTVVHDRAA
jgi:hypothetical protein